jgi:hypothetical protein
VARLFGPVPLISRGNSLRYPLDSMLGGPLRLSEHCGEESCTVGNRTRAIHPVSVVILTQLTQLPPHNTRVINQVARDGRGL